MSHSLPTTTGLPGAPPTQRPVGASAPDLRQALLSAQAEVKGLAQQAVAAGVAVPFEQDIERLRASLGSSPLVVWVPCSSGAILDELARHFGWEVPAMSTAAVGDAMQVRELYRDTFAWTSGSPRSSVVWLCTVGPIDPVVQDWLAFDADLVLTAATQPVPVGAAAVLWQLHNNVNDTDGARSSAPARPGTPLIASTGDLGQWTGSAWLTDPRHPVREACMIRARMWRLGVVLSAMEQLASENGRRLKSRRMRDEIRTKQLDHDLSHDPLKPLAESARLELEVQAGVLQRAVLAQGRGTFGPDGTLLTSLRTAIERIGPPDLIPIAGTETDRLRMNDRTHLALLEVLKQHLRTALKQDWSALDAGRQRMEESLGQKLDVRLGTDFGTEQAYLQSFGASIAIENTYSGEVPRASFLKHLSHGKQAVFTAMGILTLAGMLLQSNWRQHYWVVLLLLPLFIVGVYISARSLKAEIAARMDKELEKARELLLREVKRVLAEVQRDRQARIQAAVEAIKREMLRQLDVSVRASAQQRTDQLQRSRTELRERSRGLDGKLRDAATLAGNASRIRLTVAQGALEAERAIRATPGLASTGL